MVTDETLETTARIARPVGRLSCLSLLASSDPVAVTIGTINLAIIEGVQRL